MSMSGAAPAARAETGEGSGRAENRSSAGESGRAGPASRGSPVGVEQRFAHWPVEPRTGLRDDESEPSPDAPDR